MADRVMTVPEVAAVLRVARNTVYGAVARGEIPALRCGRRILVPVHVIEDMIEASGSRPTLTRDPAGVGEPRE